MAGVETQGTEFTLELLPPKKGEKEWASVCLSVYNEFIDYGVEEKVPILEVEGLLVSLSRLLAGGYEREHTFALEGMGLAVDMYARTHNGRSVARALRAKEDCVVAVRLLMRSKDKQFLGGVYTLLLHRAEVEEFTAELWREYRKYYAERIPGSGKYRFVGVSPRGYEGCNYLYLDETNSLKVGEYAWVKMGKRQIEQVVRIDSARYYDEEDAPYNPHTVKRILRKATPAEIEEYLKKWK